MFELFEVSIPTVPQYIKYAESYPDLIGDLGDLKDVQRPWAFEACRAHLEPRARVIDLGGAACELAGVLKRKFAVTVVDPYEGHGDGPKSSQPYRKLHPELEFYEGYLTRGTPLTGFDCVVSTSVVEHIPVEAHDDTVAGIYESLKPGGFSIHSIDVSLWGVDGFLESSKPLAESWIAAHGPRIDIDQISRDALQDMETYYLSVQMYNRWRKKRSYANYPWRKVTSLNVVMRKL